MHEPHKPDLFIKVLLELLSLLSKWLLLVCESYSYVPWQEIDAIEAAIETLREKRQEFKKDFDEQVWFMWFMYVDGS